MEGASCSAPCSPVSRRTAWSSAEAAEAAWAAGDEVVEALRPAPCPPASGAAAAFSTASCGGGGGLARSTWTAGMGSLGEPRPLLLLPQHGGSPLAGSNPLPRPARSLSPKQAVMRSRQRRHQGAPAPPEGSGGEEGLSGGDEGEGEGSTRAGEHSPFHAGVQHAGWLWKRFGHGVKTRWKRLWFYLEDDRLCYYQADDAAAPPAASWAARRAGGAGGGAAPGAAASTLGGTGASAAALAAGQVRYVSLDRIPVRPLPHRQHEPSPMRRSHPDVGVALLDARVLEGDPSGACSPPRAVFSLVAGSHTHYLAAESEREAALWVAAIRRAWLHCFEHTARRTRSAGNSLGGGGAALASQRLLAENAVLRESLEEANRRAQQSNYGYWRKWVEEKARSQVLESRLLHTVTYDVVVRTAAVKGAGTDARVYIELLGPEWAGGAAGAGAGAQAGGPGGSGGEVRLLDPDSRGRPFARGAVDSFAVLCHDVGAPAWLRVWHDNTGRDPDWFLSEVRVRKQGARDWACFPCSRWLSTRLDDGRICRQLAAGAARPLLSYRLAVATSDLRGAGTDANVHVQLHGLLGDGLRHALAGGVRDFERGSRSEFVLQDGDLGELTAVTVGHDGAGSSPAWHLECVEVTPLPGGGDAPGARASSPSHSPGGGSGSEGPTYLFPCGAWLDERQGDGKTERRLLVASGPGPPSERWYRLHLTTSDLRGAGTDADVHVALAGTEGSSGQLRLPSKPGQFARGQRDTFKLALPPLGQLQKLVVGHNGRGEAPSWHLSLAEVEEEATGRVTFFAADRWLGPAAADGLSEVALPASAGDPRKALAEYEVRFVTSRQRGAGTESSVGFELRGALGSTGPVEVNAGRGAFSRGGSDAFAYRRPWLGHLRSIAVWHDNGGAPAGHGPWHLEAVVVTCSHDQQQVVFPCGRWLSADTQLLVELTPGQGPSLARYRLEVVTSSERGAGTDGAVTLELLGADAAGQAAGSAAGPWCLDRPGAFARGQTDAFVVEGAALGAPTALRVALGGGAPACAAADWRLSHVVCTVLPPEGPGTAEAAGGQAAATEGGSGGGSGGGRVYYFVAERWFGAAHGTGATLPASSRPPARDAGALPHLVRLFTSDLKGAGTDAAVSVNVHGHRGASGWQQLPGRPDSFERGREDCFTLKLPDLGALTHLGVRLEGWDGAPAWHLDKACVVAPAASSALAALGGDGGQQRRSAAARAAGAQGGGQPAWFAARRWLDASHGLEVLLEAQADDPSASLAAYQLQAHTSDARNAGTDARVFVELVGERGSSGAQELRGGGGAASFSRGACDDFALRLPRLGTLLAARVWLEGPGSPWALELLAVTGPESGEVVFFPCGGWVRLAAPGAAGGARAEPGTALAPLELPATSEDPRRRLRDYKVVTRTSDVRGAATDAAAFVELVDAAGASSGALQLPAAGPGAFARGSVDEFRLRCRALGELARLRIGHDGSGLHPAWHLLQVEASEVAPPGRTWFFGADCWLDAAQGDGKAERWLAASAADPLANRRTYRVTVHTSKRPGAGTSGAVFVTLQGSHGLPLTCTPASAAAQPPRPGAAAAPQAGAGPWLTSARCELRGCIQAAFEEGGAGSCTLPSTANLGQLRQLTLELEGSSAAGEPATWHCQHLAVESVTTGEAWLFPCDAWLSSGAGPAAGAGAGAGAAPDRGKALLQLAPAQSLEAMWRAQQEEEQHRRREQYAVEVYTANAEGAGTAAGVSITLFGAAGEAGPLQLSQPGRGAFEPGSCKVFDLAAPATLGTLTRLRVACDGSDPGSSWLLDAVCVTARTSGAATWFFGGLCLGGATGLEATLQGSSADPRTHLATYRVLLQAAGPRGGDSGCSGARMYAQLVGHGGPTGGPQELRAALPGTGTGAAERIGAVAHELRCRELGELEELVLWRQGSSSDSGAAGPDGWSLRYAEVQHAATGQVWFFPCSGEWPAGAQRGGGGAMRRALRVARGFDPSSLLCGYRVTVTTGDVRGAGTSASPWIDVRGTGGGTGRQRLAGPGAGAGGCFARGRTGEFRLRAADVGRMTHAALGHDGGGASPAWLVRLVEVEHLGTGQVLRLAADRWLDASRPGGTPECELWPAGEGEGAASAAPGAEAPGAEAPGAEAPGAEAPGAEAPGAEAPGAEAPAAAAAAATIVWELLLVTGDRPGAGTDADVFVELRGSASSFGPHELPAGPEAFEAGRRDSFAFAAPDLGELREVVIGHNNLGGAPAWLLQALELTNTRTGATYAWASVAAWISEATSLSHTLRVQQQQQQQEQQQQQVEAVTAPGVPQEGGCSYRLEVQTSDEEGAGTSAAVFVQLHGAAGESEALRLQASGGGSGTGGGEGGEDPRAPFQRGSLDAFVLRGLPDLGQLTHLRIGHDGSGPQPTWHLAWVRAVNVSTGAAAWFPAGLWLDARRPGGSGWTQLAATPDCGVPQQQRPALQQQRSSRRSRAGEPSGGGSAPPAKPAAAWLLHSAAAAPQPGYKVVFNTSNVWGAGTGSRVFFELVGEQGSSGVVYPRGGRCAQPFLRGHLDAFLYPRLPWLGQLHTLRVGSDGAGLFAAWHLRSVEVVHVHSGQRWLFACADWIDRRCGWQRLLPAAAAPALAFGGSVL